jgi:hypothetical protein
MITVKKMKEARDEVHLYFDGTGNRWLEELLKKGSQSTWVV